MDAFVLGALWLVFALFALKAVRTFQADPEPTPLYAAAATLVSTVITLGSLGVVVVAVESTVANVSGSTTTTTYTYAQIPAPNIASSVGGAGVGALSAFLAVISMAKANLTRVKGTTAARRFEE